MKTLNVVIERSENNYAAYLQEVDGVVAVGASVAEIKRNIIAAVGVLLESCKEMGCEVPQELMGEYTLNFKMDVESFLNFYSTIFTKSALERISGINQKQLWHYAKGLKKPRAEQAVKLETALHKLGEELLSIQL